MEQIKKTVAQIVGEMIQRDSGEITGEKRLAQDLGIKSANRIGLAALLEDQFHVTIDIFDIMKVKTIDDLCTLIKKKQE